MLFLWDCYGIENGFLRDPMVFPRDSYGNLVVFLWNVHDVFMIFSGVTLGFK